MHRSRRQRARRLLVLSGFVVLVAAAGGWWYFRPAAKKAAADVKPPVAANTPVGKPEKAAPLAANKTAPPTAAGRPAELTRTETPRSATTKPVAGDVKLASDEQVVPSAHATTQPATSQPSASQPVEPSAFHFKSAAEPNDPAPQDPTATRASNDTRTGNRNIEDARKLFENGQVIEGRHQLNALLKDNLSESEAGEVRALLTRIADDTVFSRRVTPSDPLVDSYVVQPGDNLINIGKSHDVPYEALMEINGVSDPTKIRVEQKLKVLRGPFHVKIYKSKFRMDVYVQELYVRSYRVGLGTENGTPEGVWKVKNRLPDPTYYPPASAAEKRIIPPGDPTNPLGKHWIGLEGVEGEAVGHEGYGIHGTIEPESIGKAVSLGCIRMRNEDVAFVYKLLMPGRSMVTILP